MSLVEDWITAKRKLDEAKALELQLRDKITPLILGDKMSGSKTASLYGIKLRATARLNYSIDEAELTTIADNLLDEELACIVWKPQLKESLYNKLPEDSQLRTVVTVKPGQAGLALA